MHQCPEHFRGRDIGSSLYGLKSLKDWPETRQLILALAAKVEEAQANDIRPPEVANALYGLKQVRSRRSDSTTTGPPQTVY